jgi:hypothetical protein
VQLHPAQRGAGTAAGRDAGDRAEPQLRDEQPRHVEQAVAGPLDPLCEADDEQHRDRVVEPRLALERVDDPARQRGAAQDAEHRGAVRRGQDRAEQQPEQWRQAEERHRRDAREHRGDDRAHDRQRERRPQHRSQVGEVRAEAAFEEDQRERERPDPARGLIVVEPDPAGPVGANGDPDRQEQDERGEAKPLRGERGEQRACQQRSRD